MRDLQQLLDLCDLIASQAEGQVPDELCIRARERFDDLRMRAARVTSSLVVAIVGGTGSGKSSLLNAVAGEAVAGTGRLRPFTEEPMAWVPARHDPGLELMLDDVGITKRHLHEQMSGVALIDLPDVDSVVPTHRATAERVMARVDGLLWVLDPEKYHDALIHHDFLAPLSPYAGQTAFVLNKIDLLGPQDFPRVVADVATALAGAGYREPQLFPVAAAPANNGAPQGIDPLARHLAEGMDPKRITLGKLFTDLGDMLRELGEAGGVWRGGSIRFAGRWTVTREAALAALRPTSRAPSEDALCRIEDLVAAAAAEIDGDTGEEIRQHIGHDVILEALTAAQSAVAVDDRATARRALEEGVAGPLRDMLWHRTHFAGLLAQAHVATRQLAARHDLRLA